MNKTDRIKQYKKFMDFKKPIYPIRVETLDSLGCCGILKL